MHWLHRLLPGTIVCWARTSVPLPGSVTATPVPTRTLSFLQYPMYFYDTSAHLAFLSFFFSIQHEHLVPAQCLLSVFGARLLFPGSACPLARDNGMC